MTSHCIAASGVICCSDLPPRVERVADYVLEGPINNLSRWTLHGIPMRYASTKELKTKLPECVQGLSPSDCSKDGRGDSHLATVACALCYLATGGVDEAHNLVTPLSWGVPTDFAGPPVPGSPAAHEASYTHALIHRREGEHVGEFGTGWNNSGFWTSQTGRHPVMEALKEQADAIAAESGNRQLLEHMQGHAEGWNPQHFLGFCSRAASGDDLELRELCERVQVAEWRLLLEHCCRNQ